MGQATIPYSVSDTTLTTLNYRSDQAPFTIDATRTPTLTCCTSGTSRSTGSGCSTMCGIRSAKGPVPPLIGLPYSARPLPVRQGLYRGGQVPDPRLRGPPPITMVTQPSTPRHRNQGAAQQVIVAPKPIINGEEGHELGELNRDANNKQEKAAKRQAEREARK